MVETVDLSDYEAEGPLHEIFRNQAKKTPDATAVVDHDGRTITFKDLDECTDILATNLIVKGCNVGSVVGVLMERSLEWTICYIAIHKAGGGYLPLETSYPAALLKSVFEDAKPSIIVTKDKYMARLEGTTVPKILIENDFLPKLVMENKISAIPVNFPKIGLDDIAYVVYSSGTTGTPKGIVCPHRGSVHAYKWRHKAYPYEENEREACNVFFVWEMLRPLLKGITMYIISDEEIYDPPRVAKFIEDNRITRILFTPSLLETIIKYKGVNVVKSFKTLKIIIFCGEVVTTNVRDQIAALCPWIKLINLYSISECHDVSSADISNPNLIKEGRKYCSVGKALPYVRILTLDENLMENRIGAPGDIYIGSPALAIGYLNRPDLNSKKIIATPEHIKKTYGDRLYNTGDWGYALGDGTFEIIGRADTMVKIRGYTVELQAIEVALRDYVGVKTCCVLCIGDEGKNKVLVAYVVNTQPLTTSELRAYLKSKFPFYMIPSKYFFLESLPILKASGKLNKAELPQLDSNAPIELSDHMSQQEKNIATIWCKVLDLYTIEKDENFFDLGGHSLAAAMCVSRMNEDLSLHLCTSDLFSHPTVQEMVSFIGNKTNVTQKLDLINEIKINSYKNEDKNVGARAQCFWKSVQLNSSKLRYGKVLLTGATGYLGIHLLQKFLTETQCTIFCIVREVPNKTLHQRIANILGKYSILLELSKYSDRLVLIKGDLGLEMLGLDQDEYISLSYDIDMVVHAAAHVNLILPYNALYKSNVLATKNLIEFSFLNKMKSLHFISSDAIYPSTGDSFDENYKVVDFKSYINTTSGYGQTKTVSEYLLLNAGQMGLPFSIVRCGNIGGSLEFKNWNLVDFNLYMLQGITRTNSAPDVDWNLEFTPVDFLTKSLIQLYTNIHHVNKIYNFINTSPVHMKSLVSTLNASGYNIQSVSYDEWIDKLNKSEGTNSLRQILHDTGKYYGLTVHNSYTTKNTKYLLKLCNESYPTTNEEMLKQYLNNLRYSNLIPNIVQAEKHSAITKDNESGFSLSGGIVNITYGNTLANKVIFVTGCSSGIGERLVRDLVSLGAKVVAVARRINRLEKLKTSLQSSPGSVIIKKLDVTVESDVKRVVNEVIGELGTIDILINNAGVMYFTLLEKYTLEEWNSMVDVNVKGVLHCIGNILPKMLQSGGRPCHILNISSNAGVRPFAGLAVYTGTKYFIEGLSGALRQEVLSRNIRVTCIQPGDIKTELLSHSTDREVVENYDISQSVPVLTTKEISQSIVFALLQPPHSAVNSILIEPPLASI